MKMADGGNQRKLTLIQNAKIYAFDEEDYNWMLFDSNFGYIHSVGRHTPPTVDVSTTDVIDVGGRRVLPGLHESHIHLGDYGLSLTNLNLSGCHSIDELKRRLSAFVKDNPDRKWINGGGWEQDKLGRYPDRRDIDEVCPDKPVILYRVCGHIAVVNSQALRQAGIDEKTVYPEGKIEVYPEGHPLCGMPTGLIREVADKLYANFLIPTKTEMFSAIKEAVRRCLQYGVTSVHALDDKNTWDVFCDLIDKGQLDIRVFYVPYWQSSDVQSCLPEAGQSKGKLLSCDRVKLFSDGALGPCTAAISLPYKHGDNNRGILLYSQTELNRLVADVTSRGYRLEVHAIGDAAADAVMTSLEMGKVAPDKRPILVHCQILRKDVIERMSSLGVIASIQPQFVPTDTRWIHEILPDELMEYAYVWKTLIESNILCCAGSDAPVESPQPLRGIYDAIFRYSADGETCYRPDQCLSVHQAVALYTKNASYATRREHDLGQLLPGYQADFIVLDAERDPIHHPEEFAKATVFQAWVAGVRRL